MHDVFPSSANFFDAANIDSSTRDRISLTDFNIRRRFVKSVDVTNAFCPSPRAGASPTLPSCPLVFVVEETGRRGDTTRRQRFWTKLYAMSKNRSVMGLKPRSQIRR